MNNAMITQETWKMEVVNAIDSLPVDAADAIKPDMLGQLDAEQNYPFAPEMFYVKHSDKCLYAAGFASVRGPSYLTDEFLVGSEVESIEDDHAFIRYGGA